jgi:hypothetical protein
MLQKIKAKFSSKRFFSILGLSLLVFVAQTSPTNAQTITQGYNTDNPIQRATLVSLTLDDPLKIEPASLDNIERLHGVVVARNDATFVLTAEDEETLVATNGRFEMFVSDENGVIQQGDFITVSRVVGIGLKASESEVSIVGKANGSFDGKTAVLSTTEAIVNGVNQIVSIGRIQVDVGVAGNPLYVPTKANVPGILEEFASSVANKPVSATRIYISMFMILATGVVSGTLLYSGVRNSVVAVGRNPLSKISITKSLLQIILTSVIILLLGIFGVYLLLRL